MTKKILTFTVAIILIGSIGQVNAQSNKEKKSKYYQNSEPDADFDVQGFVINRDKKEVDKKTEEEEYDVKVNRNENDGKYHGEKRVTKRIDSDETTEPTESSEAPKEERAPRAPKAKEGYYTTYGTYVPYNENREKYDKYYGKGTPPPPPAPVVYEQAPPPPPPPPPAPPRMPRKQKVRKETEIKMTDNEHEYKTTVVKRRYTNLDVLCDDLDLAKVQRPVFKGICSECANDVDLIITNKNLSSLEKNYQLKTCYMMRDKRLRETLDDDQYKKFLRVKDADEYLILTKDPELKDGVNH